MIEQDTIRLLRECEAGTKMGISSIEDIQDYVSNTKMKERLQKCLEEHNELKGEIDKELIRFHDEGKEPGMMIRGMSWIKTNFKLTLDRSNEVIADLITDGCNMGIKSLERYLNQFKAADERSKKLARKLIKSEETLVTDLRPYL